MRCCPQACRDEANSVLRRLSGPNAALTATELWHQTEPSWHEPCQDRPKFDRPNVPVAWCWWPVDHTRLVGQTLQNTGRRRPRWSGGANFSGPVKTIEGAASGSRQRLTRHVFGEHREDLTRRDCTQFEFWPTAMRVLVVVDHLLRCGPRLIEQVPVVGAVEQALQEFQFWQANRFNPDVLSQAGEPGSRCKRRPTE